MSAPGSRLARQMRPHLGAGLWDEFVAHANRHYKAGWLRAFAPALGVLRYVGTLDDAPCMHAALVDLRAGAGTGMGRKREVGKAPERLHLDHKAWREGRTVSHGSSVPFIGSITCETKLLNTSTYIIVHQ